MKPKLFDRLEKVFDELKRDSGKTKSRILVDAGIDPAHYRGYHKANRPLTDEMLERLGNSPHFPYSASTLKAWKLIDEYGADTLVEALRILGQEESGS